MGLNNLNVRSRAVTDLACHLDEDFCVIDVGASNGVQRIFKPFGERLRFYGFDPLVAEMDRLNKLETNPKVTYEAAFVSKPGHVPKVSSHGRRPGSGARRHAAVQAKLRMGYDRVKEEFNAGQPVELTDRVITLDERFRDVGYEAVDFIKIDTDGHDIDVLMGAEELLREGGVLGLDIEVRFNGPQRDTSNIFRNVDRILGMAGFALFQLDTKNYARAALPRPFVKNKPTVSAHGQIRWGNALYLRDLGDPMYEAVTGFEPTRAKVLKAICLYDLFDLPDSAIEIAKKYSSLLEGVCPVETIFDRLTPKIAGQEMTYDEYMEQFDKAIEAKEFYRFGREIL